MVIFANGEPFMPTNGSNIDVPMVDGETVPVLGTYEEFPDQEVITQIAYAWIE